MRINGLKLKNYRNHSDLDLTFDGGITLIHGENGAGKTNVLEAIHLISTGKSLRAQYDKDLIAHRESFCTVMADVTTNDDDYKLQLQVIKSEKYENASSKKAKINGNAKAINSFTGVFNSVLFTPESIQLITNSPSKRRLYLDSVLSQVDGKYKRYASDYGKAIRQRNKILSTLFEIPSAEEQLVFWTNKILETGVYIQGKRKTLIKYLSKEMNKNGKELNEPQTEIQMEYLQNEISKKRLKEYKQKEIYVGSTLVGPHRDDFKITYDGYDVAAFGSRGQQRSALLGLKLAEFVFIENTAGEKPVLLLDDIFSELDNNHRKAVLKIIEGDDTLQTFITCTKIVDVMQKFENSSAISL